MACKNDHDNYVIVLNKQRDCDICMKTLPDMIWGCHSCDPEPPDARKEEKWRFSGVGGQQPFTNCLKDICFSFVLEMYNVLACNFCNEVFLR